MTNTSNNTASRKYIPTTMRDAARRADLIAYLNEKHPGSIFFGPHKDHPESFYWRSTKHDSLIFYGSKDEQDCPINKYYWWGLDKEVKNGTRSEQDAEGDSIEYLMQFENYTYEDAVYSLANFIPSYCKEWVHSSDTDIPLTDSDRERLDAFDSLGISPLQMYDILDAACWFHLEDYVLTYQIIANAFSFNEEKTKGEQ